MSSSKEPETLQDFLDLWYREHVVSSNKNAVGVIERFKAKAENDVSLLSAAREKLKTLNGIPDDKCFVSKIHRLFLNQVVN